MSAMGQSPPGHPALVRIDVCCSLASDQIADKS
jgi:hypothetical protein